MDYSTLSDQELDQLLLGDTGKAKPSAESISDKDLDALLLGGGDAKKAEPEITKTESGLRGAAQGASLGFADEISGGVEALWEKAKGDPKVFGELYKKFRDESRENFDEAQKANPKTYMAGEIGAGVATALVPGVGIARGAKLAGVAAKSAAIGGVAGAGYSEGENADEILRDAATGAIVAGGLGGAAHAVAPAVAAGAGKVSGGLRSGAEKMAARAMGAQKHLVRRMGIDKVKAAGGQALDEGVIGPIAGTQTMIKRNEAVKKAGGELMGSVYDQIDDAGKSTFKPLDVAAKVDDELGGFYRSPINKAETNQLENTLESILIRGDDNIPLKEAQKLKNELDKVANWKRPPDQVTDKEKIAREAVRIVKQSIDDAAESGAKSLGKKGLVERLEAGRQKFGRASDGEKLLLNKQAMDEGNQLMSLTDWIIAGSGAGYGAGTGDWATGAALLGGKKLAGRFGPQNAALLLNKASKGVGAIPKAFNKVSKSPAAVERIGTKAVGDKVAQGLQKVAGEKEEKPLRGKEKWASDGFNKIMRDPDEKTVAKYKAMREKLLSSTKGKDLLSQISTLKPGTPAYKNTLKKLEELGGSHR